MWILFIVVVTATGVSSQQVLNLGKKTCRHYEQYYNSIPQSTGKGGEIGSWSLHYYEATCMQLGR